MHSNGPVHWETIYSSTRIKSKFLPNYLLRIGTDALCNMLVPVCPIFAFVLPQPAMIPFLPVKSIEDVGKQIGRIWFLRNGVINFKVQWFSALANILTDKWLEWLVVAMPNHSDPVEWSETETLDERSFSERDAFQQLTAPMWNLNFECPILLNKQWCPWFLLVVCSVLLWRCSVVTLSTENLIW